MRSLVSKGLDKVLRECINNKPFLGICLGLQSLMDETEEDNGTAGMGIISGQVKKFETAVEDDDGSILKIPHMGWNQVVQEKNHALWKGIESGERFYFVHSYHVQPSRKEDKVGSCTYTVDFAAAIARDNIFATQFHPEKSQQAGLALLANFLKWNP